MSQLWVIVPAFQEEARIGATLAALRAQTDRDFRLLVVDNGSIDDTAKIAREAGAEVIVETDKGVGCAVDTGFRYAISNGAEWLARTDADCLPRPGWLAAARSSFEAGAGILFNDLTMQFALRTRGRLAIPGGGSRRATARAAARRRDADA